MYIPSQGNKELSTIDLDEMEYPNYPDNCWTLDVAKQSNETPSYIRFWFDANPEYSVEILVEDKMSALKRANAVAKFSTTGQMIKKAQCVKPLRLLVNQGILLFLPFLNTFDKTSLSVFKGFCPFPVSRHFQQKRHHPGAQNDLLDVRLLPKYQTIAISSSTFYHLKLSTFVGKNKCSILFSHFIPFHYIA